jgi:hypothetical protein
MGFGHRAGWVLAFVSAAGAHADLTLRHSFSFKFASFVPAEIQSQAGEQMKTALPQDVLLQIKGDRVYSSFGSLFTIADYGSNQITVLDPKTKQFATVPLNEYFDRIGTAQDIPPLSPDAQRSLGGLSFDVQTRKTGQTSMIQGIRAEENVVMVTVNAPGLQGAPSSMRLEMQFWVAPVAEIRRTPALAELAAYVERARRAFDPAQMIQNTFAMVPGMGDSLRTALEALLQANSGVMLKVHTGVYISALAQLMAASGRAPAGVDPNGPFAEFAMDLAEISSAPIEDSVFTVPADYQAAPFAQLIQRQVQASPLAPAVTPSRPLR